MGFLDEWLQRQLAFFGGKGGVDKTAMAVASGMAVDSYFPQPISGITAPRGLEAVLFSTGRKR